MERATSQPPVLGLWALVAAAQVLALLPVLSDGVVPPSAPTSCTA
jgi:hypothetical protein